MDNFISESVVKNENPAIAMGVTGKQHLSTVYLMDCIAGMKQYPDKFFDLAVVDPPYRDKNQPTKEMRNKVNGKMKNFGLKPTELFFIELWRVSKNQIIWGANNFFEILPNTNCFLFWYKRNPMPNYSDGELAWTSFDKVAKCIPIDHFGAHTADKDKVHPTQKPVKLYDWLFNEYAERGQRVLDTHLGSGSSRIAACKAGLPFIGFETDQEYFDLGNKRFFDFARQGSLF